MSPSEQPTRRDMKVLSFERQKHETLADGEDKNVKH